MDETKLLPVLATEDPRPALDHATLIEASRNFYPVVARRARRSDGAGLATGATIALLLGGATFWSMSGGRQPPARVAAPAAAKPAVPVPMLLPSSAGARPAVPAPIPVAAPTPSAPAAVNVASVPPSPVMIFDGSSAPAQLAAAAAPAPRDGKPAPAGTALSDTEAFAARVGDGAVDVASATHMADPSSTIAQGTLIAAVLETAIDSDLPGYVRALVTQDVRSFDGSRVLIPRSARLIGQYKSGLVAGQRRAYVLWTRLLRADGVSVALASPATDFAGRSGLTGEVDSHFVPRFGSAILLSVVGGLSAIASGGASLIVSGGQSAASVAAQRDAQMPPTVRVPIGQPIRIFTARDLDFSKIVEDAP